MTRDLADEIVQKETAFAERPAAPNAVIIPSICGKETKLHNILSKADKAKDTLLTICRLQFLPDKKDRPKLEALETAIEKSLSAEPQLIAAWKGAAKYFTLVRNARNASEHPKDNYRIILSDFACVLMEKSILHLSKYSIQTHPIMTAPLTEFLEFIRNTMLEYAEVMLAFIRFAVLLNLISSGNGLLSFRRERGVINTFDIIVRSMCKILGAYWDNENYKFDVLQPDDRAIGNSLHHQQT
jgi:hypothetical protein